MPEPEQWESYFDAGRIMDSFGCRELTGDVVEFGCGYGTFTIPTAQRIIGREYALDIDALMVQSTSKRIADAGLTNVTVEQRDFVAHGCGRASGSATLALLFNILHIEDPLALLKEAYRALRPEGTAAIIHWNHDSRTPRGPPLTIRPRPEQCRSWGEQAGFQWKWTEGLRGSPWHWGMLLAKPRAW